MQEAHVVPVHDEIEHEIYAFDECVCGPRCEFLDRGVLVIHHALDARERFEMHVNGREAK